MCDTVTGVITFESETLQSLTKNESTVENYLSIWIELQIVDLQSSNELSQLQKVMIDNQQRTESDTKTQGHIPHEDACPKKGKK